MEKIKTVEYKIAWTNNLDDIFHKDFIFVENQVFDANMSEDVFKKKYIDNIYGPSLLVLAYIQGQPVGSDALWRNDIDGKLAYQSVDTCVLPLARGKGVFTGMVRKKLASVEKEAIIYGFPNVNSTHGFLKTGWHLIDECYTTILISSKSLTEENKIKIDRNYAKWWYAGVDDLFSLNKRGRWWLVAKRKYILYSVLGELEEDAASLFPTLKGAKIFLYKSHCKTFYNKNRVPMRIITSPTTIVDTIPSWKLDSI